MSNYSVSLKGIGIENFKAFGEYQHFDLAPLTIITGPNNSGKSALVAALELLSKNDIFSHLDFHSSGLDIGDLSQVINSKSKSGEMVFELDFQINPNQKYFENVILHVANNFSVRLVYELSIIKKLELKFSGEPRLSINFLENSSNSKSTWKFEAKIDFEYFLQKYLDDYELNYQSALLEKRPGIGFNNLTNSYVHGGEQFFQEAPFQGEMFNQVDLEKFPSLMNVKTLIVKEMSASKQISCYSFANNRLTFESERDISSPACGSSHKHIHQDDSKGIIYGIIEELLHLIEYDTDINYVNRFEELIIKHLKDNDEKLDLENRLISYNKTEENEHGEISCSFEEENIEVKKCPKFSNPFNSFMEILGNDLMTILSLTKTEIQKSIKLEALRATNDRIYQYKQLHIPLTREIINAAKSFDRTKQSEFFRKWTGAEYFNFFEDPTLVVVEGVGYRFFVKKDGTKRELPDLGFGTRQVIPVILGLFNNKEVPFIVEEPESNLHPRLQSLLADLFVEVKNENPGSPLIIETHSEYLIRKLQYLVATQKVSPESIAIHYIGEDKGKGRDIFKINIDKDGSLNRSFGTGFFDEADNIAMELFILSKHQKN